MRRLQNFEHLLLVFGLAMLCAYLLGLAQRTLFSRAALQSFKSEYLSSAGDPKQLEVLPAVDFTLWSPKRIKDYEDSLSTHSARAIGILRIPKIHLEAPILEGTDDFSLNQGIGRIPGTAAIAAPGNVGIAGHRDGFFRKLKDVVVGDEVEIVTHADTRTYVVDRVIIVDPHDISVLKPRERPSLTLVTCYPFYFVGSAPQRYIVQASLTHSVVRERVASDRFRPIQEQASKENPQ